MRVFDDGTFELLGETAEAAALPRQAPHMAGRAVGALALGRRFERVVIFPEPKWEPPNLSFSQIVYGEDAAAYADWELAICALCGPAAEARFTGLPFDDVLQICDGTLMEASDHFGFDEHHWDDKPWDAAKAAAQQLIDKHWPVVTRLAEVLLKRRSHSLTYHQAVGLVGELPIFARSCPW